MTNKSLLFLLLFSTLLFACNGTKEDPSRRRPVFEKSGPAVTIHIQNEKKLVYGDTLFVEASGSEKDGEITAIEVFHVGNNAKIGEDASSKIALSPEVVGGGDIRLKIEVQFSSGKKSTRYKTVKIKAGEKAQNWDLEVLARYPHSEHAYTQGFLIYDGFLYEGTGTYGGSKIMKSELKTGKILMEKPIGGEYFGEGITIFDNKLYQLTYKAGKAFVYDVATFEKINEFSYHFQTSEGWGLTHNDTSLIASDGSASLYFLNPNDFTIQKIIQVFDENGSVLNVNELEYTDGIIYANLYTSTRIIAIDSKTGQVLNNYTARGIVMQSEATPDMDVLNGIAINPQNGNLLITGKNWSRIYEVRPKLSGV